MIPATLNYNYGFQVQNKDIIRNGNGGYNFVDGQDKLKRDIVKIILTNMQTNGYGTSLYKLFGQKLSSSSIKQRIIDSVGSALQYLTEQQLTILNMLADERISDLDIYVYRQIDDPRFVNFSLIIYTESGEVVDTLPVFSQQVA